MLVIREYRPSFVDSEGPVRETELVHPEEILDIDWIEEKKHLIPGSETFIDDGLVWVKLGNSKLIIATVSEVGPTYIVSRDFGGFPYIECKTCGRRSYNGNDMANYYCGNCHKYHHG